MVGTSPDQSDFIPPTFVTAFNVGINPEREVLKIKKTGKAKLLKVSCG